MSTLMKSAMFRLPTFWMHPTVPWRQMSPMWLGPLPTTVCVNDGEDAVASVVIAITGCHSFCAFGLLGCSRTGVSSHTKPRGPGSPAPTQPNTLVPLSWSTRMGADHSLCEWSGVSFEYE